MSDEPVPIPQPTTALEGPAPDTPPHLRPRTPGVVGVLGIAPEGGDELGALYKGTYRFDRRGNIRPADEPEPLDSEGTPHDPIEGFEGDPSWKVLPELVGWKTGTDVVVQGVARPSRPETSMEVAVSVGPQRVALSVTGRRLMDRVGGRVVFSDPEPFEELPLRWEYAYGGRDALFEGEVLAGAEEDRAESIRRVRAAYEGIYGDSPPQPLEYPRNPFGMGWVLGGDQGRVEGRELPRIERTDDLLTPDRVTVRNPLYWALQPIPGGFDYVFPTTFPRSAMIGLPPASAVSFGTFPEVAQGLLPADFCRRNAVAAAAEDYPDLLHPLASRCAPHGLQFPFLQGNEGILLEGMDPDYPKLPLELPRHRPTFVIPFPGRGSMDVPGMLLLVSIDTEEGLLRMIWSARVSLASPLPAERSAELEETIQIRMQEL
jgi:hypothetical protein